MIHPNPGWLIPRLTIIDINIFGNLYGKNEWGRKPWNQGFLKGGGNFSTLFD